MLFNQIVSCIWYKPRDVVTWLLKEHTGPDNKG